MNFGKSILRQTLLGCTMLLASGTLSLTSAQPLDIAGTYTINPAGGAFDPGANDNFLSFNEAIDTLISRGVSGEVIINVADGLYTEAFTISAIPGSGPDNWVTFQSASADATKMYLDFSGYNSDTTSVITLAGASYITFRHLGFDLTRGSSSYGQGIKITDNCQHITFDNNLFIGKTGYSSYSDNRSLIVGLSDAGEYLEFRNNQFNLGENGIKLYGSAGALGIIIEENEFIDQLEASVSLRDIESPVCKNNSISILSYTGKRGIYLRYVSKGFEVSGNTIKMDNCNTAIQIEDCTGNPGDEGMIYNNFVSNAGSGTSYNYGIHLHNTTYTNVYHNSVNQHSGWASSSRAFYQNSGGNNLKVMNNSFQNSSGGYASYVTDGSSILTTDNNNYYSNGNFLARWESSELTTLEGLKTASSQDASSISANPWHTSNTDLHTTSFWLESMGADLTAAVATDIDGDPRSATPDIGADEFTGSGVALSGEYFIGGAGPDYATLQAAADDLSRYGVSGPVILSIRDDDSPYSGLVTLEPVTGTSETNTITISPDPANTGDVILVNDGTAAENHTLNIFRGNNMIINDLILAAANDRYSTIIRLRGYATNITITGCSLNSLGTYSGNAAIFGSDVTINTIAIDDNSFTGGTRGVEINGMNNISFKPKKVSITNNSFSDHYYGGIYLEDCIAPDISGNMIEAGTNNSYNFYGIYINDCNDNFKIHNNKVLFNADDGGIRVYNCSGSSVFTGSLINNYIEMYAGGDAVNGIDMYNSSYVNVYFNTSRIFEGNNNTNSNAFYNYNGSNIRVKNNNFVNFGSGRAYYNSSATAILESDYNNLFSTGFLGYWNGNNYANLEDWQTATGQEVQSISHNPWFLLQGEPDINSSFLDNMGTTLAGISTDINGETRQDPPDIGAFEFTSTQTPIAEGTYTVGGTAPDYLTLTAAFADLQNRGISGSVILNIRSGEYNEIVPKLINISGSGPDNRITVQSETGNPEDVQFYYMTTSSASTSNIISLSGVSYFTLKDLTISALGTQYGRPVSLSNNVDNIEIVNTILTSANTRYSVLNITGISINTTVRNNTISGGSGGISLVGDYNNYGTGNKIIENHISGGSSFGIQLNYQYAPHIIANTIENRVYSGFEGITCSYCPDRLIISGNRINNTESDYGIYLNNCSAVNPFYGLVSNNSIRTGGTYYASGIYVTGCKRTLLYNNSINITSNHALYGRGIYTTTSNSELEIINNIIANSGPGPAMELTDMTDIAVSDYNNLYTTGETLVNGNNTPYANLAAWKSAGSLDANSMSVQPKFYSNDDLRSSQAQFHEAAIPLATVTHDIDSLERDTLKPDLGAYEFSCVTPEFNVYFSEACLGDSTVFIDSSLNIAYGSNRGWDLTGDMVPDILTSDSDNSFKWLFNNAGTHTVTYIVQQVAGCNDFVSLEVPITPSPQLSLETSGAYCDTDDGRAVVEVTNMDGPFSYYWSNGTTESTAEQLALGTYSVTVTTPNGCSNTEEFDIGEAIEVSGTPLTPATCGQSNGSASVSATGGVAPYTYVWSNDVTGTANDSLPPGLHYVNVTDAGGCSAREEVLIANDGGPAITIANVVNNSCYGDRSGSIDLTISGGTEPYDILWSNGAETEDLSGLSAGVYNVTVTDDNNCPVSGSFEVAQPTPLSATTDVTTSSCLGADGVAIVNVIGGTRPYSYAWGNGDTERIADQLEAGVYTVTVTDDNGCQLVEPVIIDNVGAPLVSITDVQGVTCLGTDNGSISVVATPSDPFYNYSWSSGQTTPDISGLAKGTYDITVTDDAGCKGVNRAVITEEPPQMQPICIVTVDTTSGMNMVVWEKDVTTDVAYYNIYRESTSKGQYEVVGSVPVTEEGIFIDSTADPRVRSWRYKLSVVDVCGIESDLSPHHKTMHLTINTGIDNTINLIWDNYEGFEVGTYDVWRLDEESDWQKIAELPSNLFTYSDLDAPTGVLDYYIEVEHPTGCFTEKKAFSLNTSRSNRKSTKKSASDSDTTGTGLIIIPDEELTLNIYPNPGNGKYHVDLRMEQAAEIRMTVFDIAGKLLMDERINSQQNRIETQLDLSGYSNGLYQVRIMTNRKLIHRIIIKE
ncbi:MAG: T9SS type A sorting domain-containing protein [Bacteroidales bacterium]